MKRWWIYTTVAFRNIYSSFKPMNPGWDCSQGTWTLSPSGSGIWERQDLAELSLCRVCWAWRSSRLQCGRHEQPCSRAVHTLGCSWGCSGSLTCSPWWGWQLGWGQPLLKGEVQGLHLSCCASGAGLCVHKCAGTQVLVKHQHTNTRPHITGWFQGRELVTWNFFSSAISWENARWGFI